MDEDKEYHINDKYLQIKLHPSLKIYSKCQCNTSVNIIPGEDTLHGEFELKCEQCGGKAFLLSAIKSLEQSEPNAVASDSE